MSSVERKDRVQDQSTTTGTGTLTLGLVAPTGFQTMAAHTSGATVRYILETQDGSSWEVGLGVWTSGANTLSRVLVYASSNSGALVSLPAGVKIVSTGPAAVDLDELSIAIAFNTAGTSLYLQSNFGVL